MELDRELIAAVVERQLFLHPDFRGNWSALERGSKVSHSVMMRMKKADERVSSASFRRLEAALGLPFDTLDTIGKHDLDVLPELGVDPALITWLRPRIHTEGPGKKSG